MRSIPEELNTCPLCQEEWHFSNCFNGMNWEDSNCPNEIDCQITLYRGKGSCIGQFYLKRYVGEHTIWWGSYSDCEIEQPYQKERFRKIGAWLPFDIDQERLKLILLLG